MRRFAVIVLCAALVAAPVSQAQMNPGVIAVFKPSPLGIVLTVGQWIFLTDNKRVYYIEVAGRGPTEQQARNNGFRLAVEQALGTLISSETEVQNGRIVRDEIISYAAGFVDRFEIVSTRTVDNEVEVAMKVWVGRSALADRLLNRSEKSGEVDGATASVRLQTLNQERATGDAILQQVLNDFPKRAFDIDLKPADVLRHNRSARMELTFTLSWNKDYLRSLWTALEATSQRTSNPVTSIYLASGGWFGGFGGQARFDDTHKWSLLVNRMVGIRPAVLATVRGAHRQVLYSACYTYQELDHLPQYHINDNRFVRYGSNFAQIMGSYKMRSTVEVPINPAVLHQITTVDVDVVPHAQCPNR